MKYYNAERFYEPGEKLYCVLTTPSSPNVIIPVKAQVVSSQWDSVSPLYSVKILNFYESLNYLEENFLNCAYRYDLNTNKTKRPVMSTIAYKTVEEFTAVIHKDNTFVVDGTVCVNSKTQLEELFESIQFYIISTTIRDLKHHFTRPFLNGPFKMTKNEFDNRFKSCFGESFERYKVNIHKYLATL